MTEEQLNTATFCSDINTSLLIVHCIATLAIHRDQYTFIYKRALVSICRSHIV